MQITMEWLKSKSACQEGCNWFLNQKETDSVKVLKKLIKEKKLDWANWLIVRIMDYKTYVGYAVFAAEQVIRIYEKKYPGNKKPREAIKAAKKCIENPSEENKNAAYAAANAANATVHAVAYAANAAYATYAATYAAVHAATYAANASNAAVHAATYAANASNAAVHAATYAANASNAAVHAATNAAYASNAVKAAVHAATYAAANAAMKLKILKYGLKLLEE